MLSAELVFFCEVFFLPLAHKIIRVALKLTGSVGNQNQIKTFFRPQRNSGMGDEIHTRLIVKCKCRIKSNVI